MSGTSTSIALRTASSSRWPTARDSWRCWKAEPASASDFSRKPACRGQHASSSVPMASYWRPATTTAASGSGNRPPAGSFDRSSSASPRRSRRSGSASLAFTTDGRALVASGDGFGMRMVEVDTGNLLWEDPGGDGKIAILPGGRLLVTGGWDRKLSVRDLATGKVQTSTRFRPERHGRPRLHARRQAHGHRPSRWVRLPARPGFWRGPQGMAGTRTGPGGLERVVWSRGDLARVSGGPDSESVGHAHREGTPQVRGAYQPGLVRPVCGGRPDCPLRFDGPDRVRVGCMSKLGPTEARTTEQLWDDLIGEPEAAFRAVWLAAADPKARLFGKKMPSPTKLDAERFEKLVTELSSEEFQEREAAERELAKFGSAALDPYEEGTRRFRLSGGADTTRSGNQRLNGESIRPGGLGGASGQWWRWSWPAPTRRGSSSPAGPRTPPARRSRTMRPQRSSGWR